MTVLMGSEYDKLIEEICDIIDRTDDSEEYEFFKNIYDTLEYAYNENNR